MSGNVQEYIDYGKKLMKENPYYQKYKEQFNASQNAESSNAEKVSRILKQLSIPTTSETKEIEVPELTIGENGRIQGNAVDIYNDLFESLGVKNPYSSLIEELEEGQIIDVASKEEIEKEEIPDLFSGATASGDSSNIEKENKGLFGKLGDFIKSFLPEDHPTTEEKNDTSTDDSLINEETQEKKGIWDTIKDWASKMGNWAMSGVAASNEAITGLPRTIYNATESLAGKFVEATTGEKAPTQREIIESFLPEDHPRTEGEKSETPISDFLGSFSEKQGEIKNQYIQKATEGASGTQNFIGEGVHNIVKLVPTILMAIASGGSSLAVDQSGILSQVSSIIPGLTKATTSAFGGQLKTMIPFMTQAAGSYALESAERGDSPEEQLAHATYGAFAEGLTEMLPMGNLIKVLGIGDDVAKPIIKKGVIGILEKLGIKGLQWLENYGLNVLQEVVVDPITGVAEKAWSNPDMPIIGDEGILSAKKAKEAITGATAMEIVMFALGLPASTMSFKKASSYVGKEVTSSQLEDLRQTVEEDLKNENIKTETIEKEGTTPAIENKESEQISNIEQETGTTKALTPTEKWEQVIKDLEEKKYNGVITERQIEAAKEKLNALKQKQTNNESAGNTGAIEKPAEIKLNDWVDSISLDDVDYNIAKSAYAWNSMDPEKRANSIQSEYVADMTQVYDKLISLAESESQKQILSSELNRFKIGYIEHLNKWLTAKSRTANPMVTGSSNFPVAKNQKALDTAQKRLTEFIDWQEKAVKSIEKKIQSKSKTVFKTKMFRGEGKDKSEIYAGVDVPAAGEGTYYAFTENKARNYGDKITEHDVTLENPLYIRNDDDMHKIAREGAGWKYLNLYGLNKNEVTKMTKQLKEYVLSQGYDGIVFEFEFNEGDEAKSLFRLLGHDQVVKYTNDKIDNLKSVEIGKEGKAYTENNDEIQFKYAAVNIDDVISSHDTNLYKNPDYPQELQPRQRDRKTSILQVDEIAGKLNPELLGENVKVSDGAPIVGEDLVVESGNGRTIALKKIYKNDLPAKQKYIDWLNENKEKFGIENIPDNPMLVRIRTTDVDRTDFTRKANESSVSSMSATEHAAIDAEKITDEILFKFVPNENGNLNTLNNKAFIGGFINTLPSTERGKLITKDGLLSQEGYTRVRNAVFYKAYRSDVLIDKLAESLNDNMKNVINSMVNVAPHIVQIKQNIKSGDMFELDFSDDIANAAVKFSDLKKTDMTVDEFLSQASLFDDLSNNSKDILSIFEQNSRSAKKITLFLNCLTGAVNDTGSPNQMSLLGDTKPTKSDIIECAIRRFSYEINGQENVSVFETKHENSKQDVQSLADGKTKVQSSTGTESIINKKIREMPFNEGNKEGDIIKRSNIVKFVSEYLDIPVAIGKYRQRAKGIYKIDPEIIRLKKANDLDTLYHEMGHHFDKKMKLRDISSDELYNLGQPVSRPSYSKNQVVKEGVAEFIRYYVVDETTALKKAPQFYKQFKEKVNQDIRLNSFLKTLQTATNNYIKMDSTGRILAQISIGKKEKKYQLSLSKMYAEVFDDIHGIKKAVERITGKTKLDILDDPYKQAWLQKGWSGKAMAWLENGVMDIEGNTLSKSFNDIINPVKNELDAFRAYATAKRALELEKRGIETGLMHKDIVNELEKGTKLFDKTLDELVKYQNAMLNELVKSGVVSKDAQNAMKELNKHYIPFYRVMDSFRTTGYKGKGYQVGNPIKGIKGSARDIIDPLESIIKNTFMYANIIARNNVGQSLVRLQNKYEGAGKVIDKVPTPIKATNFNLNEVNKDIKNTLEEMGIDVNEINDIDKLATIFRPGRYSPSEKVITIYKNGKPQYYEIHDEMLYDAFVSLDRQGAGTLEKLISYPTKILRAGAILTPEFVARNPVRDALSAFTYSRYGFIPGLDTMKGLWTAISKNDYYYKWMNSGGAQAALVSLDRDYLQGEMRKLLQSKKAFILKTLANPIKTLQILSEVLESSTRLGEFQKGYKKEIKRGSSETQALQKAALSSRDITIDFARGGRLSKWANKYFAFFNVAIQGPDKMRRAFIENPVRTSIKTLIGITLPSILIYLKYHDDKRWQDIKQWQKDTFWCIPLGKDEDDSILRIPKPFEMGVLFGTFFERFLAYVKEEDKDAFDGFAKRVLESALPDWLPTAIKPIAEANANYSYFKKYNIVPQSEEKLEPWAQYSEYTSETAKAVGKILNVSPRVIENTLYGYGGGLSRYGLDTLDVILATVGLVDKKQLPKKTIEDLPLIKGFTIRPFESSQYIDDFYNELDKYEKKYNTYGKDSMNDTDYAYLVSLRKFSKALSALRKAKEKFYSSDEFNPEEKREKIDMINKSMANIAKMAVKNE